jgi:hypothetical protein
VNDIARLNVFSRPRRGRPAPKIKDRNDLHAKDKRCGNKWRLRLSYDLYPPPLSCMSMTAPDSVAVGVCYNQEWGDVESKRSKF